VRVWRNDGNGQMTEVFSSLINAYDVKKFTTSPPVMFGAAGHFNNDSFEDFVLGSGEGHSISLSLGDGQFTRTDTIEANNSIIELAAADFDGDGLDDRLALTSESNSLFIKIYLADGGSLQLPIQLSPFGNRELLIVETDGDALPDFALVKGTTARIFSIENGTITDGQSLVSTATSNGQAMWADGDVDANGSEDLTCFGRLNGTGDIAEVVTKSVSQVWAANPWQAGGQAEFLADVDGDGDLDGVCCAGGGTTDPTYPKLNFNSTFQVALNDGTGVFADAFSFEGMGSTQLAGVADFDADGDAYLVAGACIYYSDGPLVRTPVLSQISLSQNYIDVDRDGDLDISATYSFKPDFEYRLNQGNGQFSTSYSPITEPGGDLVLEKFIQGDFVGNGAPDLVSFLRTKGTGAFIQMVMLRNNGSGQLLPYVPAGDEGDDFTATHLQAFNPFVADADGDGDLDIFTRSAMAKPKTTLYLNDGNGYFTFESNYFMKIEALEDFDGDGILDMLGDKNGSMTGQKPQMWIALGNPPGSADIFATNLNAFGLVEPDSYEHRLDVQDFNNDGKLDVAFIDTDDQPHLFFNTTTAPGNFSFQETESWMAC
jgi:hypothetical protein